MLGFASLLVRVLLLHVLVAGWDLAASGHRERGIWNIVR